MQNIYRFIWESSDKNGGKVIDKVSNSVVFEIKNISIVNAKLRPDGDIIISEEVPLPLYWQQYADHENPERNAGYIKNMYITNCIDKIIFNIESTNYSESITSKYELQVSYSEYLRSYEYLIKAELRVNPEKEWMITYNPTHGEIEFCNFYPSGVFSKKPEINKKYKYCIYEDKMDYSIQLPHIHFDTEIYKNLPLKIKGNFYYLLEDENPVIRIIGCKPEKLMPGICSYMWDSHFGIRVCEDEKPVTLNQNECFSAIYKVFSIPRDEGERILKTSLLKEPEDIKTAPIFHQGVNSFSKTLFDFENIVDIWPWQNEHNLEDKTAVTFTLDNHTGYTDNHSLFIKLKNPGYARWIYTALGPEYGKKDFPIEKQLELRAFVKFPKNKDNTFARIGLRIHFKDEESIFNIEKYALYYSEKIEKNDDNWTLCICTSPVLLKLPDRVHLLLEINGEGTCWFDNVSLEII